MAILDKSLFKQGKEIDRRKTCMKFKGNQMIYDLKCPLSKATYDNYFGGHFGYPPQNGNIDKVQCL